MFGPTCRPSSKLSPLADWLQTEGRRTDVTCSLVVLGADLCGKHTQSAVCVFVSWQDLRETLEQLRSELQVKACALRDREAATRSEITDRDETIAQLQQSLHRKDALLQVTRCFHAVGKMPFHFGQTFTVFFFQEYSELLNHSSDSGGASERDALLHALRSRIRDRDAALEVCHVIISVTNRCCVVLVAPPTA